MGALPPPIPLYVGCYTTANRPGIHRFDVGPDGTVTRLDIHDGVQQASFLAPRPDMATLYAVRETDDTGAIVALRTSGDTLTVIDEVASHGAAPCHVSSRGDRVYVANYGSGTVSAYRLRPDGTFGPLVGTHRHEGSGPHTRQDGPHAHCVVPSADGTSVYATDLGNDRIIRYVERHDENGDEQFVVADETPMTPGSGPRHLCFHPTLPVMFVVGELDCTLVVADVDPHSGRLEPRDAVSTLPAGADDASIAAEVTVHPDGTRVYVSNRGHDSIATYALDATGTPELVEHVSSGGRTPRHIAVHPAGRLLLAANQHSGTIVAFELDDSGVPRQLGTVAELFEPVCLAFAAPE